MKKWIMKLIGITDLLEEQRRTNKILDSIYYETKRNSDLVKAYNKAYHIN